MKAVAHSSKVIEDVLGINNNVSLFQNTGASAVATLAITSPFWIRRFANSPAPEARFLCSR
jgi:hypothetical protein